MQHCGSTDLSTGKRIVIKIGSTLLVDEVRGVLQRQWLETLAQDLAALYDEGRDIVLVSSGAIAIGRRYLKMADRRLHLTEKQAAAAVGMVRLSHAYQEILNHHGITVAQILLTLDDSENRRRYINARNTINTLLKMRAIPLINENDTVATDEIRFGDNDRLGARVAAMIGADTLVLLSDIDGLYTVDPNKNPDAQHIPEITKITPEIENMASHSISTHGSGGMVTKLAAAKICLASGCRMVISKGRSLHPLRCLREGVPSTWFLPSINPTSARKQWIASTLKPVGCLYVDAGVIDALQKGKSLLPAGVTRVEGDFLRGDPVIVFDPEGREIARGLIAYPSDHARKISGHKTSEIETILGYRGRDEMIHRDDLSVR